MDNDGFSPALKVMLAIATLQSDQTGAAFQQVVRATGISVRHAIPVVQRLYLASLISVDDDEFRLKRPAEAITLREIYICTLPDMIPGGTSFEFLLDRLTTMAREAALRDLSNPSLPSTLADALRQIR